MAVLGCGLLFASTLMPGCGELERSDSPQVAAVQSALSGTWTALSNAPPAKLDTCLLLTNGDAMCHEFRSNRWHRLTPDAFGSYQNGRWDAPPIAAMPNGNDPSFGCVNCTYAPLYYASAVLPDGRAIVIGGEYNNGAAVWTNIGFIYDPVANAWSSQLQEAFGGGNVGDAQGMVLQDGTFVLTNIVTTNMEALNPATGVFTARNPTGKLDINNEENWSILYDGSVLTVDAFIKSSFERYTPSTNTWGNSGATPVNLADTGGSPVGNSHEVGPCMLRPDGKLVCFSGNALGQNAIYNPSSNTWSHAAAMDFPAASGGGHFAMADGAAAALPNGNILVMASPVTATNPFNAPSHFYEVDLATNTLSAVTDSPNAASFVAYQGRMLVLPTGEVLLTAYNQGAVQDVMLYSNGGAPAASWRPVITSAPTMITARGVYSISGTLFNGFSEGTAYGDDAQSASNYPLVRITSTATGHVNYARTFNHSRMGVEPVGSATVVTTSFEVPPGFENGPATLAVVANGIASQPVNVNTRFSAPQLWSNFFCIDGEVCKAGDVNGDGKADIIAFNHGINGGGTAVFVGLSNGTSFAPAQQWSSFFCLPTETCLVGDVNGDGKADIVALTRSPSHQVFVSLSNGASFGPAQLWSGFFCLSGEVCKLADVNGDGKADIVAFNHGVNGGGTAVFVGLSNGTSFGTSQQWSSYFCLSNEACEVGDVNGDGKADVIAFTLGANPWAVVSLSSGASFGPPQLWSSFFCLTGEICRAADFNGDGKADIMAFNHGVNGGTAVFLGESTGTSFTAAQDVSPFFCLSTETCEVGDVTGDGNADMIAFTGGANPVAVVSISTP